MNPRLAALCREVAIPASLSCGDRGIWFCGDRQHRRGTIVERLAPFSYRRRRVCDKTTADLVAAADAVAAADR